MRKSSPMLCDHANEVPARRSCPRDCYCKKHTCKVKKPKTYIRPDDGEVFSLNKDGKTYSLAWMKRHFPKHLHHKWSEQIMRSFGFTPK